MKIFNKEENKTLIGGRLPEMEKVMEVPQTKIDQVYFSPMIAGVAISCRFPIFYIKKIQSIPDYIMLTSCSEYQRFIN